MQVLTHSVQLARLLTVGLGLHWHCIRLHGRDQGLFAGRLAPCIRPLRVWNLNLSRHYRYCKEKCRPDSMPGNESDCCNVSGCGNGSKQAAISSSDVSSSLDDTHTLSSWSIFSTWGARLDSISCSRLKTPAHDQYCYQLSINAVTWKTKHITWVYLDNCSKQLQYVYRRKVKWQKRKTSQSYKQIWKYNIIARTNFLWCSFHSESSFTIDRKLLLYSSAVSYVCSGLKWTFKQCTVYRYLIKLN